MIPGVPTGLLPGGAIAVDGELCSGRLAPPRDPPQTIRRGPAGGRHSGGLAGMCLRPPRRWAKAVGLGVPLPRLRPRQFKRLLHRLQPTRLGSWLALQVLGADFVGCHSLWGGDRGQNVSRPATGGDSAFASSSRRMTGPGATLRTWSKESASWRLGSGRTLGWRWSAISAARIIVGTGTAVSAVKRRLSADV